MHFLKTLFFQWAPFMIIHELTRILRNKLVVFNILFSGGTATPTSTLRLETLNRDMSPNSRVTNLDRFHYSKNVIFDSIGGHKIWTMSHESYDILYGIWRLKT